MKTTSLHVNCGIQFYKTVGVCHVVKYGPRIQQMLYWVEGEDSPGYTCWLFSERITSWVTITRQLSLNIHELRVQQFVKTGDIKCVVGREFIKFRFLCNGTKAHHFEQRLVCAHFLYVVVIKPLRDFSIKTLRKQEIFDF